MISRLSDATIIGAGLTVLALANASAQTSGQRTYANPIDIDYRYNFEQHNEGSHLEYK